MTYTLARKTFAFQFRLFILILVTFAGFALVLNLIAVVLRKQSPDILSVAWLGPILLVVSWAFLRSPTTVSIDEAGLACFKALLKTTTIPADDIQEIRPFFLARGLFVIRHTSGNILLLLPIRNILGFFERLHAANPSLVVGVLVNPRAPRWMQDV
jgi:hypothetical protein